MVYDVAEKYFGAMVRYTKQYGWETQHLECISIDGKHIVFQTGKQSFKRCTTKKWSKEGGRLASWLQDPTLREAKGCGIRTPLNEDGRGIRKLGIQ